MRPALSLYPMPQYPPSRAASTLQLGHWVAHHIDEVDDVDAALEGLQDLDLASDLGLLDGLEDLDHDAFVVRRVDSFVHFRVLASADLLDDLVVVLGPKRLLKGVKYPNLTSKFS